MNCIRLFLCLVIFIQAMSSWGQGDSVIRDGKEWLQPTDFGDYTYDEVSAVCPDGVCSGALPGSSFDLSGYTWASIDDVNALLNSYGISPPFTAPFQERRDREAALAINEDFKTTSIVNPEGGVFEALVRNPAPPGYPALVTLVWVYDIYNITYETGGFVWFRTGVWFWRWVGGFRVLLEEPIDGEAHSGIGNLRGWAISEDGIDRVEIYIDGKYMYDAPFGGERFDVGDQYPDIADSDNSGFSLAFGYSNLGVGQHTVTARAFDTLGEYMESTAIFEVVAFHKDFINKWDIVDTSQASMTATGDEILLDNVSVDGQPYELRLKWRTPEQGFEIIEIR